MLKVRPPRGEDELAILEDAKDGCRVYHELIEHFIRSGTTLPQSNRRLVQEYIKQCNVDNIACDTLRILRSVVPEGKWQNVQLDQQLYVASQLRHVPEEYWQTRCIYIDPCFRIGFTQSRIQAVASIACGRRQQTGGQGRLAQCLDAQVSTNITSLLPWITLASSKRIELSHPLGKQKKRKIRGQMSMCAEKQAMWVASYILMQLYNKEMSTTDPVLCASFGILTSRQTLHGVVVDRSWRYAVKLSPSRKRSNTFVKSNVKYSKRKINNWSSLVSMPREQSRWCTEPQSSPIDPPSSADSILAVNVSSEALEQEMQSDGKVESIVSQQASEDVDKELHDTILSLLLL